jgi:hypothetical protein
MYVEWSADKETVVYVAKTQAVMNTTFRTEQIEEVLESFRNERSKGFDDLL